MVNNAIASLTEWLEKKGYEVSLTARTCYIDYDLKEVGINNCGKKLYALYSLAHEAGHLLLYKNKKYGIEYRSVSYAENIDARHGKSRMYRYKKLSEEINAWESGYKLLTKLGYKINYEDYSWYASRWVNTYIKYLAKSNGPTE